jgi:autotransporter-associated beta strand protein
LNGTLSSNIASNQFAARLYNFAGGGNIVVAGNLAKGGEFTMQNLTVTKDGTGTLTLAGTNDYSGNTSLNNGTTVLSGTINESAVVTLAAAATLDVSSHAPAGYTFGSTQTLRGSGTVVGEASTAGVVSPGFSAGNLNVTGDFSFSAGSTYLAEIDALGTVQVETATAAGTATADGNVAVTVTGAGITGSPLALDVAVLNGETPAGWAAKVRAALAAAPAVTALYSVGGINEQITLTRLAGANNDTTLNLALDNGNPSPGIAAAPASANTTSGVAPGHDTLAVTGALDVSGAILDLAVTGTPTAPAYVIATYGSLTGTFAAVNNLPAGYVINYSYNSGTAIALVTGAPADNYTSWAAANGISGEPFDDDFDHDGLDNGLEYALAGLIPTGPDGSPGVFANNTLTFNKRSEAVANGDVAYAIQTSTSLAPGSWTTVIPNTNNDTTISCTLPTGQGTIFARLVVTRLP